MSLRATAHRQHAATILVWRVIAEYMPANQGKDSRFSAFYTARYEALCRRQFPRSEKCHKQSFDHLGGAGDQGRRKADAERLRRLEIDDELEVRGQLERHVRGPRAA